jgi:protein JSN1
MSSARSEHLTLGYLSQPAAGLPRSGSSTANTSPTDPSSGSALRSPFGLSSGLNSAGKMAGSTRSGAGSPSHELGGSASRLFSKRYDSASPP